MKNLALLLTLALALGACSGKSNDASQPANKVLAAGTTGEAPSLPPDHPPIGDPAAAAPSMGASSGKITGTVAETMDSGGYTYLKLKTDAGEQWAAVPQAKVAVGSTVVLNSQMVMNGFESKTLKRTFDKIIFGNLEGQPAAAGMSGMAFPPAMSGSEPMGGMKSTPPVDVKNIKVEKAEGANGKTVAELWGQRTSLSGKPVVVRGKVVKYLPGIMARNWIHLRDGSGSDASKDNDITVTTLDAAAVGDVIVVRGTVRIDQDFGAGYTYKVIVEDAKVTK